MSVSQVINHANYDASTVDNDIALLKTSAKLTLGTVNAQIASLPTQGADVTSGDVTTSGWGQLTESNTALPTALQIVTFPVISRSVCASAYSALGWAVTENMFCAGLLGVGGKDACSADSGGPIWQNDQVVGLVSWGAGCASPVYPGVYARLGNYIDWIKANSGVGFRASF